MDLALAKIDQEIKDVKNDIEFLQERLDRLTVKRRNIAKELEEQSPKKAENKKETVLAVLPDEIGPSKANDQKFEKKDFTVVFTMPYQGIYGNEFEAQRIITGNPGIKYKKFKSGIEAEASLAMFRSQFGNTPFDEETYSKVIESKPVEKSNLVPLGEIRFRETEESLNQAITFQQWKLFANTIRKDEGISSQSNKYFSVENGNSSKYNLLAGINPKLCYHLYMAGLVENIYPSKDLRELDCFPYGFKKVIENFQRRALKNSDRDIFLSTQASLPWWENGEFHRPYHFIRLGTKMQNQAFKQPVKLDEFDFQESDLEDLRAEGLFRVYQDTRSITPDKQMRINYKTSKVIIASYFNREISSDDMKKLQNYRDAFHVNHLDVDEGTKRKFCEKVKKVGDDMVHTCTYCLPTETKSEDLCAE